MQNPKITTPIKTSIKKNINSKLENQPFFGALKLLVITLQDNLQDKNLRDKKIYPRIVGGCVRDFLLNKNPEDIDLATTLEPEEVIKRINEINKTVIPTGLKHGTVTIIIDNYKFEVTTLRIDVKCDGRRAQVAFNKNFKLDAQRRDFTINAMSYCIIRKKLYDYFNGLKHLEIRKVMFIGDADRRIKEDALRILRFFRFSSYYANEIDSCGLNSCIKNKKLLQNLSQERITSELNKILISKNMYILFSMREILEEINLSEINLEELNKLIIFINKNINKNKITDNIHNQSPLPNELELIYAILFSEIQNPQMQLSKMRHPNSFIKKIQKIIWFDKEINNKNSEEDLILFLKLNYKSNESIYEEILLLVDFRLKIDKTKLTHLKQWLKKIPNFEIHGHDLIKFEIHGPKIKIIIDNLYLEWIRSDCKLTKPELISKIELLKSTLNL